MEALRLLKRNPFTGDQLTGMSLKRLNTACVMMVTLLLSVAAQAYTEQEQQVFDEAPPRIRPLLMQASDLMGQQSSLDANWQAAKLYCEAAALGSAEGMYRLGMLYAFGQGVDESLGYASSLFKSAAMSGHFKSQKMLETIPLRSLETPPCLVSGNAPPKSQKLVQAERAKAEREKRVGIDELLDRLPQNKRWLIGMAEKVAEKYDIDPKLVLTIISVESNFKTLARSNKAAQGLMQLIPATAARFNVKNAYDASQNIKGGVAYLRWLLSYFQGDVVLAVAAYNAGEGAVDRYKGVPPYRETRNYVNKVKARYPFATHPFDQNLTNPSPIL